MSVTTKGLLLINLGTPDSPQRRDVARYLNQFLTDGRVIDIPWLRRQLLVRGIIVPFRTGNSTKLYQELWTEKGSPLKYYGEQLLAKVRTLLSEEWSVALAMRYQNPSIEEGIEYLLSQGADHLVIFPLFPQYASATTGSAHDEVFRVLRKRDVIPSITMIKDYFDHPGFIESFVQIAGNYDLETYDHVLFSYHGLPQRQLVKADPGNHCLQSAYCCQSIQSRNRHCYSAQCYATTAAIVDQLNLSPHQYTTCFQSRLGKAIWTKPYTSDVIHHRAEQGDKRILVFCPAFVADCLETTIEIGVEYQEEFENAGGKSLDLVPSLNAGDRWSKAILEIIRDKSNLGF